MAAEHARERERELECDADSGEILVRVAAPGTSRVEHGKAIGERPARQVVVGDDHVDPGATGRRHRIAGARAAIAREEHRRAPRDGGLDAGRREIVAVLDAARDERLGAPAEQADGAQEERRRADAVHVVVAVHEHELAGRDGARETLDGAIHVEHLRGIVQLLELRAEIPLGGLDGREAALTEQAADVTREPELLGERVDRGGSRFRRHHPASLRTNACSGCGHARKLRVARRGDNGARAHADHDAA